MIGPATEQGFYSMVVRTTSCSHDLTNEPCPFLEFSFPLNSAFNLRAALKNAHCLDNNGLLLSQPGLLKLVTVSS